MIEIDEDTRRRIPIVLKKLQEAYPDARCSLEFSSPLELLIATILSAQCTDERVNLVTPALFAKYPTAVDYAAAPIEDLEQAVRSTGFFHNKAKNIQAACRMIVEDYDGSVPNTMKDLLRLPGVARKTANVVLSNAFGIVEGVIVDTHAGRISRRLGFSRHNDPAKVETDLMAILPQESWLDYNHQVIYHGRAVCTSQRPKCEICTLAPECPSAGMPPA